MKGLSLPTAEIFSGMVCFLICIFYLTLFKARRSEKTTKTYVFLAIAYGFQGLRRACGLLAMHGVTFAGRVIDPLYIVWTFTLWLGVRAYGRKTTFHPVWLMVPAMLIAWSLVARGLDISRLWHLLPMHLTGAVFLFLASVHIWRLNREQQNWGLTVLSILFLPFALNTAIFPFVNHTWYGPYGYMLASGLNLAIGMGMMLTALLDEQEELVSEMKGRKLAEEALERERTLLRNLIDNMPDRVYAKDTESRFILCNEAMVRRMGKTSMAEIVGKSDFDLLPLEMAQRFYADEQAIIRSGTSMLNREEPLTIEGGKITRWNLTSKVPLLDRHGNRIGIVGMGREITDLKQSEEERRALEERLQRAEKMEALGQLAGGVAHDLNNVLGVLSGYSELLLMETPEGSRSRGHLEKIVQSTEKGAAIIQDLLTLARRGVTASGVINLNSVVSVFLKTPVFEKMKEYHPRVTFRTECDKNLLNIKGSSVHLEKTLMNLVANASESISGQGEVTIRTQSRYLDKTIRGYDEVKEGDYAVLIVSDTGMGIPAEDREKIFEPFYTKKTMGRSGTGLGLSIVWGTVKDHNGYIDLQTEVEKGTTFTLYFPVTREELITPQQKVPIEQYMGNGESVLVVDDIAEQRDVASRLLTRLGYEVHVVSSGEEAVEYLKGNRADILVLDMIMPPGIDGLETYQRVLEINPRQKAILVSGFSETDRVKKAQKLGAGAYVKKPYMMEKIGVAIRDELLKVTISIH